MSGFVGIFNRDGRPAADDRLTHRMLDAIAFRGPDASGVWTNGAISLGHCLLRTTPESIDEQQPHHLHAEGLSIVFDGRIDNRDELLDRFDCERVRPTAAFDAAYVLCAYRLWREECASRLLGDFAFAVWDGQRRRLFCARDVIGLKGLYYHQSPSVLLFASEPQALLRHPAVSRRPNEGMVGEYLSVVTSTDDTLFSDIQRLPRACRLSVSADGCRIDKYWEIDPGREIRYQTLDDYSEHLCGLLRDAVRVRLRSCTPVGVMLSGGVDSSSVLSTATSLTGADVPTECEAFSLIPPAGVLDESYYMNRVAAMYGCRLHTFRGETPPAAEYRRAAGLRGDVPPTPNGRLTCSLKRGAAAAGVRVLLSGIWSDEWFSGSYYHCADLFRSLRWWTLVRHVRTLSRFPDLSLPGPLLKILTWPLLPRRVRKGVKLLIGRDGVPPWVRRDFARRISLADRLYPIDAEAPFPTIAQRRVYADMTSGLATLTAEEDDRTAAEFGVETRHPFADRRIMEFGMAIPEDLRWRGGTRKFILREAMRAYLPDEIRTRRTNAEASSVFIAPLRGLVDGGLFRNAAIAREGWADLGEARAFYDGLASRYANGDPSYAADVTPMWMIAAVEIWMREVVEHDIIEEESWKETAIST